MKSPFRHQFRRDWLEGGGTEGNGLKDLGKFWKFLKGLFYRDSEWRYGVQTLINEGINSLSDFRIINRVYVFVVLLEAFDFLRNLKLVGITKILFSFDQLVQNATKCPYVVLLCLLSCIKMFRTHVCDRSYKTLKQIAFFTESEVANLQLVKALGLIMRVILPTQKHWGSLDKDIFRLQITVRYSGAV